MYATDNILFLCVILKFRYTVCVSPRFGDLRVGATHGSGIFLHTIFVRYIHAITTCCLASVLFFYFWLVQAFLLAAVIPPKMCAKITDKNKTVFLLNVIELLA